MDEGEREKNYIEVGKAVEATQVLKQNKLVD